MADLQPELSGTRIGSGILAGVVEGVVFGIMMDATGMMAAVAAVVGS